MDKISRLIEKGVKIPNPHSVDIGDEVDPDRISGKDVVIYSGCKIFGRSTLILQGAKLGYEGPATVENCHVGPDVQLKGGFYKGAVFLKNVSMGYGSHVREGTILEEQSGVAHCAALKQTILFPFVTLGSLINFCDCFMSGGTDRKDHSEVGSSYIHFNFTPNQDKATPSLIGDVPYGVMLNQRPIFLGGQGGLVGPCRLAYGTVVAAGTICRKDELRQSRLIFGGVGKGGNIAYETGVFRSIKRTVVNNIVYMANLFALMQWYHHVRSQFVSEDFPEALLDGLKAKLHMGIDERIKRLEELGQKMFDSVQSYKKNRDMSSNPVKQKIEIVEKWPELKEAFTRLRNPENIIHPDLMNRFMGAVKSGINDSGRDYITVIKGLNSEAAETGTKWLQGVVDYSKDEIVKMLSSYQ